MHFPNPLHYKLNLVSKWKLYVLDISWQHSRTVSIVKDLLLLCFNSAQVHLLYFDYVWGLGV